MSLFPFDVPFSLSFSLSQFQAKYAVIGGMATAYRSQPRFTKDLDILLTIPQFLLPGLLHDLQHRGFEKAADSR